MRFVYSRVPILVLCAITLLFLPQATHAHNGAVAVAYPVEGITVDGDFSDWPRYAITRSKYGERPLEAADFRADFRVGYNALRCSFDCTYLALAKRAPTLDSTTY
jgi:hypothetical protein